MPNEAESFERQVLAFAALLQFLTETYEIAETGLYNTSVIQTAIHSILQLDASDFDAIYQGVPNLGVGLQKVQMLFGSKQKTIDSKLIRHLVTLLHLQQKLVKNKKLISKMRQGIESIQTQKSHFQFETKTITIKLADLYVQTISTLLPRLMINGEQAYLSNNDNIALIRTLLLAAMRAAVLWRQMGGSRWQLIVKKKQMLETAMRLSRGI